MSWSNKSKINYKAKRTSKTSKSKLKKVRSNGYAFPKKNVAQMNLKVKPTYDYSKHFDFNSRGRIKGSYTPDGFFEPD